MNQRVRVFLAVLLVLCLRPLQADDPGCPDAELFSGKLITDICWGCLFPIRIAGLSIGGGVSDDNAVVRFRDGTLRRPLSGEPAELRFPDEAARHKVVDLLGDLALAGADLAAKIVAFRSGHKLNAAFAMRLRQMLEEKAGPAQFLDVREILRVISAHVLCDAKFRAQERCTDLGHEFLGGIGRISEALAHVAIEAALRA